MREPVPGTVRGVLFDVDGTLVDSTYLHTVCWWQAFRQQSIDVTMAVIHRAIGMGADKLVEQVLAEGSAAESADSAALAASHAALFAGYWGSLRPLPGAAELLRRCHAAGLRTVLASSAGEPELSVLLRVLDADEAIDIVTGSADARSSKPDPDILQAALDKAGLRPGEAVFLGDAVWDVQASAQLGIACIGLESGGTSAAELSEAGAFATYADPHDLLRHEQGWLP
jgi:HAD superfamily hydrolase (TIGR01509 family)